MLKKMLVGGVVTDLSFVMVTNAYANTVIPLTSAGSQYTEHLQVMAGISGILICLSRVVKTIAEAYLIKKQADNLQPNKDEEDED